MNRDVVSSHHVVRSIAYARVHGDNDSARAHVGTIQLGATGTALVCGRDSLLVGDNTRPHAGRPAVETMNLRIHGRNVRRALRQRDQDSRLDARQDARDDAPASDAATDVVAACLPDTATATAKRQLRATIPRVKTDRHKGGTIRRGVLRAIDKVLTIPIPEVGRRQITVDGLLTFPPTAITPRELRSNVEWHLRANDNTGERNRKVSGRCATGTPYSNRALRLLTFSPIQQVLGEGDTLSTSNRTPQTTPASDRHNRMRSRSRPSATPTLAPRPNVLKQFGPVVLSCEPCNFGPSCSA